ncbi:MAG TPA: PQQ-binding-like beta-propeller repeat protein, partial [Planctomycetota bacterium]|nr:PQQ-binding-like beta-propeller repeat protein [Planctomycetota bacterium]
MKILTIVASSCLALALSWSASTEAVASDWPHFRGPFYNGSTDEKGLPDNFSLTENVAWEAPLPGPSAATPIVVGDHVFVSSVNAEDKTLVAMAFDRKTGKKLWEHTIDNQVERDDRSNFASPSPVTDGKIVVFFYGTGDMVAYDLEGKQVWERDIVQDYGEFAFLWTFASSPLLWKDKLYLQVLQRDRAVDGRGFRDRKNESYLLAMDPNTGKSLWRHVRPSQARSESLEAFSSPIPFTGKGGEAILIAGGDDLTAHDPADGSELWRWGTWNPDRITHWRLVPSPVASEDIALACAPKNAPVFAIKTDGKGKLDD